jgi:septal ring factor EnvC (AmiA/AmiB activator)
MPGLPPKLVVTTYAPTRRWVTIIVLVLLIAGGVYGMFEFGRWRAGFDAIAAFNQQRTLRAQIAASETTISELRAKVAQLESSTVGQTREREEVQRTIGDLQAQLARANQELAFSAGSSLKMRTRPR